ncbi:Ryncolin-4 [Holothuria leucospilota]|uniref:Ryncolin-4 n=1 Tax=Holothuria leucospilota TaxID=206669 RepID=A0A9Q1H5U1_HOLLE|nr:Ryncolin-4 [Holothuria leucospilota]
MTFGNCSCQATCEDPRNENGCHNTCTEEYACVCKEGYLLRGNDCIRAQDCQCFVQGAGVIQNGESYINPDCLRRCSCNGNQLTCESYQCGTGETCVEVEGAYQCECDDGFVRDGRNCVLAVDCKTLYDSGVTTNGVYTIKPSSWSGSGFQVYCEMESNGGGWTVIFQRRVDGTVNFYRNWASYKQGFGSLTHEFWLGNDKIHAITNQKTYQLRVDAVNSQGTSIFNTYSSFRITDENDKYRLRLGSKSGNTGGDAMYYNNGKQFSTHNEDNDGGTTYHCAQKHRGAWWYTDYLYYYYNYCFKWRVGSYYRYCSNSNLNGDYQRSGVQGLFFYDGNSGQHCGITRSEMKLRPV